MVFASGGTRCPNVRPCEALSGLQQFNVEIASRPDYGVFDLALMVYDSEDDPEAKLVGPGPAIHHFGIEVEDTEAAIAQIEANGGTILENEPGDAIKYRAPDGTISEIVEVGRYAKKAGLE